MRALLIIFFLILPAFACAASADEADGRIRAEIASKILGSTPWDGADVEVDGIELPDLGAVSYDSFEIMLPSGIKNTGKVSVQITLKSGGSAVKTFWASARIRVFKEAVVAMNTMRINQRITASDVKLVRMEAREVPDAIVSVDEGVGMLVKRPISAGSVVKKDYLKPESIIRKGDHVVVWIENRRIKIKTAATALESGHKGGVINARSASGKEFSGRVTGPGELSVEF